jgi:hypothetical protein
VACHLIADIVGDPFHPARLPTGHRTSAVAGLAQGAYEERDLPSGHLYTARLAVLSDALEEVGCEDMEILSLLRSPGPHVRGCWAVDLCLGLS